MGRAYRRSKKARLIGRIRDQIRHIERFYPNDLGPVSELFGRCSATVTELLPHLETFGFKRLGHHLRRLQNAVEDVERARECKIRALVHLAGERGIASRELGRIAAELFAQGKPEAWYVAEGHDWESVGLLTPDQVQALIRYLSRPPDRPSPRLVVVH